MDVVQVEILLSHLTLPPSPSGVFLGVKYDVRFGSYELLSLLVDLI